MATSTVQAKAEALGAQGVFLGGPVKDFEAVGRLHLTVLLEAGLVPESKVLDVGCGMLRGGYWLMRFLDPGCYCGIEPNRERLQVGLDEIIEPELLERARPRFSHNDDFDLSVYGERFDYVIARSIWTHASKRQVVAMLDSFCEVGAEGAVLLSSYMPASEVDGSDYTGDEWVGRSHVSDTPGLVRHLPSWLAEQCESKGLAMRELPGEYNRQRWLRIERAR